MESLLTTEMQLAADDTRRRRALAGEARRLMLPGEMGEIFKVIALGRGYERRSPASARRRWPCSGLRGPLSFRIVPRRCVNEFRPGSSNNRTQAP